MGIRFRKSINLGGGFRVNISKSGIGYSCGVKGYRVTKTARGTTRRTASIPGTGISYVEETGGKKRGPSNGKENNVVAPDISRSTEIVNVADYQAAEYTELIEGIKRILNLNLLSTIMICTFLLASIPIFIFTGIAGVVLKIYIHAKMNVPIEYEFDQESEESFNNLCAVWMSMNKNKKFWQTISEQMLNKKVSGGATRGVNRIPAKAINKLPFFIKTNVQVFGLKLRKQRMFFLPDKLLVISGRKVGAINYSEMNMGFGTTNFIETDPVPKDAKIIRYTWLKVNKDGSPDKRFKGNRQVPVCQYGSILIESTNLHVELMCSNSETVAEMSEYAKKVF